MINFIWGVVATVCVIAPAIAYSNERARKAAEGTVLWQRRRDHK